MILVAFFMALFLGMFVLRSLPRNAKYHNVLLDFCLGWGLGVGLVSQITMYVILVLGKCVPGVVIVIVGIIFAGLLFFAIQRSVGVFSWDKGSAFRVVFVLAVLLFLCFLAWHLPYGGYDAWSLWNYRASSVLRGGEHWMAVFHNKVQGQHPWLLPFFTVWGWSWVGGEAFWVPMGIAVFMATATVGVLVASLADDVGELPALLAGVLLISIPFFIWHSISQYASIFVAYYALAVAVCFKKGEETGGDGWGVLVAMFLAFLASSKDEGIVLAVLFLWASWVSGFGKGILQRWLFWLVFMLALMGMLITELLMRTRVLDLPFMTSLNQHIDYTQLFDVARWKALAAFFWKKIFHHPEFGRMWLWVPLIVFGLPQRFVRFVVFVLIAYLFIFAILYVVATDPIGWRLGVSLNRVFFHLIPLFVMCAIMSVVGLAQEKLVPRVEKRL